MNLWTVIINPWAGCGLGKTEWPGIKKLLIQKGFEIKAFFTERPSHAIEIVKDAVKKGCRKFIAVGGDGTLHEVINGAMFQEEVPSTEITVGCIPVGSGNDWIKLYGIPSDHAGAIDVIAAGNSRLQDLALVKYKTETATDSRYMINVGGILFDGNTVMEFTRIKTEEGSDGKKTYIRGLFNAFRKSSPCHVDMVADGKPFYSGKILSAAFGIGKYSGGGLMQTPGAEPDDGLLDMTVFKLTGKLKVICNAWRLFNGTILKFKDALHCQLKTLSLESAYPLNLEIDGENVGTTPFTIEMAPAAINVLAPAVSE